MDAIKKGAALKKTQTNENDSENNGNNENGGEGQTKSTNSGAGLDMGSLLAAVKNPQLRKTDDRKSILSDIKEPKKPEPQTSNITDPILLRRMKEREAKEEKEEDTVASILAFAIMARRDNLTVGLDENDLNDEEEEADPDWD